MALTTAQETALLALLEAIPSDELVNINDLDSGGNITQASNLVVQHTNSGDVAKRINWGSMIISEGMTSLGEATKVITPKAFGETNASTDLFGTMKVASQANVAGGTSTNALTPSNQSDLFEAMVKNTGDVNDSDIDSSTASFAAVTVGTVLTGTIGKTSHWIGSIGVTPVFSTGFFYIYINNVKQPSFKQPFNGFYIRADNTDDTYVFGGFISAVGDADSNGLGQVLLQIRNTDEVNWYTDRVSTLYFNFRYFI